MLRQNTKKWHRHASSGSDNSTCLFCFTHFMFISWEWSYKKEHIVLCDYNCDRKITPMGEVESFSVKNITT